MRCMKAHGAVAHKTKLTLSESLYLDIVPPPQQKLGVQVLKPICACISLGLNLQAVSGFIYTVCASQTTLKPEVTVIRQTVNILNVKPHHC